MSGFFDCTIFGLDCNFVFAAIGDFFSGLGITFFAFFAPSFPTSSSHRAYSAGFVAIYPAAAPSGHQRVPPAVAPAICLVTLPVFIDRIFPTSSYAFNARISSPIQGRIFSSLSSFISFPFPVILAIACI